MSPRPIRGTKRQTVHSSDADRATSRCPERTWPTGTPRRGYVSVVESGATSKSTHGVTPLGVRKRTSRVPKFAFHVAPAPPRHRRKELRCMENLSCEGSCF